MRIWIDATRPESRLPVFGMSLVERLLRAALEGQHKRQSLRVELTRIGMDAAKRTFTQLAQSRTRPSEIWIELPPGDPDPDWIPASLVERLPIRWMREPGSTRERLQRAVRAAGGEAVLAFSGDSVVDQRVMEHLAWLPRGNAAFISDEGRASAAAVRLEEPLSDAPDEDGALLEIALAAVKGGALEQISPEQTDSYVKKLRRDVALFAFHIGDAAAQARVERFLFAANYKGSTDFLTKWVYPPIVWRLLQPLTAHRVHPNRVTIIAILACFGAVPFFAAGMWLPGLVLAYVMSVLDSVDGKLARLTFQSSEQGDVLDHGTDLVHPLFWYWSWAWALSGGNPFAGVVQASMWMAVIYIFDRILEMLFTASTGKSIHGYTELDIRMRSFISRRNVNLALFTVSLPLGLAVEAFYLIVAWQGASALFHLSRVIKFWNGDDKSAVARAKGAAGT